MRGRVLDPDGRLAPIIIEARGAASVADERKWEPLPLASLLECECGGGLGPLGRLSEADEDEDEAIDPFIFSRDAAFQRSSQRCAELDRLYDAGSAMDAGVEVDVARCKVQQN